MPHQRAAAEKLVMPIIAKVPDLAAGTTFCIEDLAEPETWHEAIPHVRQYAGILFSAWEKEGTSRYRPAHQPGGRNRRV